MNYEWSCAAHPFLYGLTIRNRSLYELMRLFMALALHYFREQLKGKRSDLLRLPLGAFLQMNKSGTLENKKLWVSFGPLSTFDRLFRINDSTYTQIIRIYVGYWVPNGLQGS
jgi:hypothetical protein